MTIDIEQTLLHSHSRSESWSEDGSLAIVRSAALQISDTTISWDAGAGEDWMSLMDSSRVYLAVRRDFPLVMKVRDPAIDVGTVADVIEVPDMYETCLKCSGETLRTVFPDFPRMSDWDDGAFSAHDLWWATI